jgi:hypothetical protein
MTGDAKVWVVTTGSYSSYRVDRLFATREAAEAWAALLDDEAEVDEWEVCDELPEHSLKLRLFQMVKWDGEGSERGATERVELVEGLHSKPACEADEYASGYEPGVRLAVSGYDHDRVRKVFSERLAKMKAEGSEGVLKARHREQYENYVTYRAKGPGYVIVSTSTDFLMGGTTNVQ